MNVALALLVLVSGVITPLGLSEEIRPAYNRTVRFDYAPDLTSFGNATMQRPNMPLSRDCHIDTQFCPGAIVPGWFYDYQGRLNTSRNDTQTATTRIPDNITAIFNSATYNSSIAGILDIQYRSWVPYMSKYFDNSQPYLKGKVRHIDLLFSHNDILAVEGVIADMRSGGIGFRNHTVPIGSEHGAEWEEDILWLEPDVSCANTNLSLEFNINPNYRAGGYIDEGTTTATGPRTESLYLVDEGGFANLRKGSRFDSWPEVNYSAPDVGSRADFAAWATNLLTAVVLNVTDLRSVGEGIKSDIGSRYVLPERAGYQVTSLTAGTNQLSGSWLYSSPDDSEKSIMKLFASLPFWCSGLRYEDLNNTNYNMGCGYFFSAPSRIDGGRNDYSEAGSKWKVNMFTCVGALKASIKTVSFKLNGTAKLESMTVQSVREKEYATKSDLPMWAFENWRFLGRQGLGGAPLWGLVDPAYAGSPGYNFSRAPSLYVPFSRGAFDLLGRGISGWERLGPLDALAGVAVPDGTLLNILTGGISSRMDGSKSSVLRQKWGSLSLTPPGAAKMLRLMWTDTMASAVVGTKQTQSLSVGNTWPVTVYASLISYDLRYAIPALLLLSVWAIILVMALILAALHWRLLSRFKSLLNDTSIGRVAVAVLHPDSRVSLRESTTEWLDEFGHVQVALGKSLDRGRDCDESSLQDVRLRKPLLPSE